MAPDQACAALTAAQLGCTRQDAVATLQLGVVLAQSHAAGQVVPAGTAVTIAYETTGPVELQRWKAPAPERANFLAALGSGHGSPGGWSSQSTLGSVYLPGTADVPGLWPVYRSRCESGCAFGYYYSPNPTAQVNYVIEAEAFRCFDPAAAPAGSRPLHALLLRDPAGWVWAVPGTGEWDAYHQPDIEIANDFVVCHIW
jgi:hypothetical protein